MKKNLLFTSIILFTSTLFGCTIQNAEHLSTPVDGERKIAETENVLLREAELNKLLLTVEDK